MLPAEQRDIVVGNSKAIGIATMWADLFCDLFFCHAVDEFAPTTPSPSGQNSLEPPTIASIVLAVVLGCILLLALFAAWRFKQRRRFLSFKIDDSDLTRPRYSTGSHQLTESSKYTGHGRKSESRKLLGWATILTNTPTLFFFFFLILHTWEPFQLNAACNWNWTATWQCLLWDACWLLEMVMQWNIHW